MCILPFSDCQAKFQSLKNQMQTRVKQIANAMQNIYQQRKCDDNILKCSRKSYDQCKGTSERQCLYDIQTPSGCGPDGTYLSKQSTILYPSNINTQNLSQEDKWITCASAYLEEEFVKQGDQTYAYQYVGFNTGSIRNYPSIRVTEDGDNCLDYDVRRRPWYVTAASGSKNVIIFIDVSRSMSGTRLSIAKQATKAVIDTLSLNDFVGIVIFSDTAQRLQPNLVRSTAQTKQRLKQKVQKLGVEGSTNYKQAFQEGFQLLKSSIEDQYGRRCPNSENIMLFLTDGQPSQPEDYKNSQSLIQLINQLNPNSIYKIRLFTYGFGNPQDINTQILNDLSCEFNGVSILIESGSSSALVSAMRNYYSVISEGVSLDQPIWTQPYDDAWGFGRIIGVSMPIYYTAPSGIKTLLGVAAVDQSFSKFSQFGTEEQVMSKLLTDLPCPNSNLDQCDLQILRSQDSKCPNLNCPNQIVTSNFQCLPSDSLSSSDIFLQPEDTTQQRCCPDSTGIIIGSVIGGVALLALIIGLIVFCCKKRGNKRKEDEIQQGGNNRMQQQNQLPPVSDERLNRGEQPYVQDKKYFSSKNPPSGINNNLEMRDPYIHNPSPYIPPK